MSLETAENRQRSAHQIVFVPGSYSPGSVWDLLAEELRKRGFGVTVAELPSNSGSASDGLHADGCYAEALLNDLNESTVIVGHSYGGMVLSEVAGHPNVTHAVYIAAFVPVVGVSMRDLVGGEFPAWVVPDPTNTFYSVNPAEAVHIMVGNAGSAELDKSFAGNLVPQSQAAGSEPSTTKGWGSTPVSYLITTDDRAMPTFAQEAMAASLGASVSTVATPHFPGLSERNVVSDLIEASAAKP
ncbi:alpha/beta hydrolase [Glaciihabitans sp. UYNi722]|uniref:alpha/beta hydrolase n=1 Tax=Glaciihabitans sp. UYNi722 TaxID=3156344 RepID=UPI003398F8F4